MEEHDDVMFPFVEYCFLVVMNRYIMSWKLLDSDFKMAFVKGFETCVVDAYNR